MYGRTAASKLALPEMTANHDCFLQTILKYQHITALVYFSNPVGFDQIVLALLMAVDAILLHAS